MGFLLSMTGFGRGEAQTKDYHIVAEIRTVNNKYLEITTKLSPNLGFFEVRAKEILRSHIDRGRVFLVINDMSQNLRLDEIRLDNSLCSALVYHLKQLSAELGLKGEVKLEHVLPFMENLHIYEQPLDNSELTVAAEGALMNAVSSLNDMRLAEGNALKDDFLKRLANIEHGIAECETLANKGSQERLEKLRNRIGELLTNQELDPYRLEMEAALLADRLDITEEIVRLKSHCAQFQKILLGGSPCGRRLSFLIQEMHRELNTSSAKADSPELSHLVVEMKDQLEKMREQAQNVE